MPHHTVHNFSSRQHQFLTVCCLVLQVTEVEDDNDNVRATSSLEKGDTARHNRVSKAAVRQVRHVRTI